MSDNLSGYDDWLDAPLEREVPARCFDCGWDLDENGDCDVGCDLTTMSDEDFFDYLDEDSINETLEELFGPGYPWK